MRAAPTSLWLLVLCASVYLLTAPGRITFPDDEIVFQTTEALAERGSFAIAGIEKRTGERPGRPSGTFGWGEGVDGRRYGFFGHAASVVALPMYALGRIAAARAPEAWRHAPRSDLFSFHARSRRADFLRIVVSLTNCLVTALTAGLLVAWMRELGFSSRAAGITGLAYAFGTSAWAYAGTLLSEPLSAACLVGAALAIARYHATGRPAPAWVAGALAGLSVHVHLLNFLALPWLLAYGLWEPWRAGRLGPERRAWGGALAAGLAGVALLALGQHLRFGSPLETGRYDHYAHFMWPWEPLLAQAVGPGRSFFLYSPALVVAVAGLGILRERAPAVLVLIAGLVLTRWLFVSFRSDWYGGWAIGPRYLVASIPFAIVPLAAVLEGAATRARARRRLLGGLFAAVLLSAWLAVHSSFEWMWALMLRHGTPEYFTRSHWDPAASPIVGFFELELPAARALLGGEWRDAIAWARFDSLGFGAIRLALAGHPSLLIVAGAVLGLAGVAARRLWTRLTLDPAAKA